MAPAVAETGADSRWAARTACVSSQVGCPVGCNFCASGINGVKEACRPIRSSNKSFASTRKLPAKERSARHQYFVFMGMGEPLANYANVMKAGCARAARSGGGLNIGARKITISTVGVPAKMREIGRRGSAAEPGDFAACSPNEQLRRELIPWAEHFSLPDILAAADSIFEKTGAGDHAGIYSAGGGERSAATGETVGEFVQNSAGECESDPVQRSGWAAVQSARCGGRGPVSGDSAERRSERPCAAEPGPGY